MKYVIRMLMLAVAVFGISCFVRLVGTEPLFAHIALINGVLATVFLAREGTRS